MTTRRTFSIEEKLAMLQEAEENGVTETCRRYDLSHSVLNRWKRKLQDEGVDGLKQGYPRINPEVRKLEEENRRLSPTISLETLVCMDILVIIIIFTVPSILTI